jgi:UDP:flavonoid glycosyltransferase YjiC (YdhE family)
LIPKIQNKKIAYSCLNWGMGHLTRSISILKELSKDNDIYFFGNQAQLDFLEDEGINIKLHIFPEYRLNFSGKSFLAEMIFQSPRMIQDIQIEKKNLSEIHQKEQFDLTISDNRFGFRINEIRSIILTHQLKIKSPFFEKQGSKLNQIYLNKFDEIWVPDDAESTLSGDLSKTPMDKPICFLGNISDLHYQEEQKEFDYFIIGSGPEPYRTQLIEKLLNHFKASDKKIVITGMDILPDLKKDNFVLVKNMNRKEINDHINKSTKVITRAGYTSLMDLECTKCEAILIPTKNQYEQEYLAEHLSGHPKFEFIREELIDTIC